VTGTGKSRGGRPKARDIVMRGLYEAEISGDDAREILELSLGRFRFTEDGREYAMRLMENCAESQERIDELISAALQNWDFSRLGAVERAILRLAVAELVSSPEVPLEVVIDEAIRLAKRYGDDGTPGFINGILDKIARSERNI
jgi:transcription antitermination protein NusB